MKKLLLVTLLGLVSYAASAATFTIDVDNAENVEVGYSKPMYGGLYYQFTPYTLHNGADNTITTADETSFICRVAGGSLAVIDLITKNGVPVTDYENIPIDDGMNIVIRTHLEDGAATCTVNCDDYTLVYISAGGNAIELSSNTQQIDFTKGDSFEIKHINPDQKLAEVKLNGVTQSEGFGNSYLLRNVADSDIIDIRANFAEYDVTFSFNNDRAREYISRVEVNAEEASDYAAGLKVQEGGYVALKINKDVANVEVTVNDIPQFVNPFFHEISFTVTGNMNVVVTAQDPPEPEKVIANVNVDKAENIKLYYVEAGLIPIFNTNVPLELIDGDNVVEIPEGVTAIYAEPATNCLLVDVKRNNEDVAIDPIKGNYAFEVENGMNISITSKVLEASASFTLICTDPSKINLQLADTPYELANDPEQTINFIPETQNNVRIEAADSDMPIKEVLHNGTAVEKLGTGFGGTPYYMITDLKDNDRIEVILPAMYNVSFSYGNGAREDYIESVVLTDKLIENYKEGFKAPEDAIVSIYVVSTISDQKISVNGTVQTPNEFSFVSFEVKADTEIKIESNAPSIFTLICADPSKIKVQLGENPCELTNDTEQTIEFEADIQNSVRIEAADSDMPIKEVLHNGIAVEKTENEVDGMPYYMISDLKDNDRIEVTLTTMYNVSFTYGEAAKEAYIQRVTIDGQTVVNHKEGFKAPEDALVAIYVDAILSDHKISINGIGQTPDDKSCVAFPLTGDTEVRIEAETSSVAIFGIESWKAVNVYSIDGKLLKENVKPEDLRTLDAGCYIIDGKKVLIGK